MNDIDVTDTHVIGGVPVGAMMDGQVYVPADDAVVETCERCDHPFYTGPRLQTIMIALDGMKEPYVKLCFKCCVQLQDDIPDDVQSLGGKSGEFVDSHAGDN